MVSADRLRPKMHLQLGYYLDFRVKGELLPGCEAVMTFLFQQRRKWIGLSLCIVGNYMLSTLQRELFIVLFRFTDPLK